MEAGEAGEAVEEEVPGGCRAEPRTAGGLNPLCWEVGSRSSLRSGPRGRTTGAEEAGQRDETQACGAGRAATSAW